MCHSGMYGLSRTTDTLIGIFSSPDRAIHYIRSRVTVNSFDDKKYIEVVFPDADTLHFILHPFQISDPLIITGPVNHSPEHRFHFRITQCNKYDDI